MNPTHLLARAAALLLRIAATLQSPLLLILRVYIARIFALEPTALPSST